MKLREFWINVDELPHYYATDKKEQTSDILVREVLPIPWNKVWVELEQWMKVHTDPQGKLIGDEFSKIQELVERALQGKL